MGKRSRKLRSSSFGMASPLDGLFCRDPADVWEEKSAPIPSLPTAPASPAVTDRPPQLRHVESDLEVVEALSPTPKTRIDSPMAPMASEAGKEAREGSLTSPVIFFIEPWSPCREPSTEGFVPEKPGELFRSCFLCKKKLKATKPIYMFGHLRAFCSPSCQTKQMKEEGIELTTELTSSNKEDEVDPM